MNSVLVYHTISSPASPCRAKSIFLRKRSGSNSLALALATGGAARQNVEPEYRVSALTFDDGYRDNLTVALPLLEMYSMPVTVFVVAGFVGTEGISRGRAAGNLAPSAGYDWSHGLWHRHFNRLPDEARLELNESRRILEEITGKEIDLMAWPYGECDSSWKPGRRMRISRIMVCLERQRRIHSLARAAGTPR